MSLPPSLDTCLITESAQLSSLVTQWNSLAAQARNPLLSFEWFKASSLIFFEPDSLRVVAVRSNDGLEAIAPLAVRIVEGSKRLVLIGNYGVSEPSGLLYRSRDALTQLMQAVLSLGEPVILSRVPLAALEVQEISELIKGAGTAVCRSEIGSPYLMIHDTFTSFENSLSPRKRSDLRRAYRKAEQYGRLFFSAESPDSTSWEAPLNRYIEIEQESWKGEAGTSLALAPQHLRFFRTISEAFSGSGIMRFFTVFVDARSIASGIAIEYDQTLWILKIGYRSSYSRCSPGVLLMHEIVRYAHERGLKCIEFLGLDEPWLHMWSDTLRNYCTVRIYPFGIEGVYGLGIDSSRHLVRAVGRVTGIGALWK